MNQLKSLDLFELDRVLEDIAKIYAAPAATVWFKVTNNRGPVKLRKNYGLNYKIFLILSTT